MSHSSVEDLTLYLKGRRRNEVEEWKRTRRLFLGIARTMGGFKGREEDLWRIDGDPEIGNVSLAKIEKWNQRLKEIKG